MIYRTYGSTGVEVSAIGFGGMRFDERNFDSDSCASLVEAAYDAGINYFDTAPGYGESEKIFGAAFKQMKNTRSRRPFYVSTKSMKAEPQQIRKDLETSLKKMNLDYIDFYHFWYVLSLDEYHRRKANGVLKEFEKLKNEGLIKHICVSTHMTGPDIGKMLRDYPFEGVLLGYSVMNFAYREAAVEAAAKLNLGVVIMNPLGGGVIPQNPERFAFVKTQPGESVVEGALRFLINDRRITIGLVGFSKQKHIKEAVSAVEGYKPIPQKTIRKIRAGLKQSFNELCTVCRYCDDCPQGIRVPELMDSYNHYVLTGKAGSMIQRLDEHWGFEFEDDFLQNCTECGQCEDACTQKLPIRERLRFIREKVKKHLASKST
jgi:predicted aldo/keto reductase-like oxidoreductase